MASFFFYLLPLLAVLFINTFNKPLPLPVHSPGHYVTLSARHGVYSPYYAHEWYPIRSASLWPVKNIIVVAGAAPSRPLLQSRSEDYALSTNKLFVLTSSEEMDLDLLKILHFFLPNDTSRLVSGNNPASVIWIKISVSASLLGSCRSLPSFHLPPPRHEMDFLYFSDAIIPNVSAQIFLLNSLHLTCNSFFCIFFSFSTGCPHSTFMSSYRWICGDLGDCKTN